MNKMKLFFVPHAGGSAMGYMRLKSFIDTENVELIPLEPAGRGRRISEGCFTTVEESERDLYHIVKESTKDAEDAFFGHSLGTLLVYEIAMLAKEEGWKPPKHIIFSGRVSPSSTSIIPEISKYADDEFLKKFNELQPVSEMWSENAQLLKMMMPILRADVLMSEQYIYKDKGKLDCDISVFYGKEDRLINDSVIDEWKNHTSKTCNVVMFEGGHFYFNDDLSEVGKHINLVLKNYK